MKTMWFKNKLGKRKKFIEILIQHFKKAKHRTEQKKNLSTTAAHLNLLHKVFLPKV